MDGIELARRANELDPDLKVMFITGFAAVALYADVEAPCEAKVLSKPFTTCATSSPRSTRSWRPPERRHPQSFTGSFNRPLASLRASDIEASFRRMGAS